MRYVAAVLTLLTVWLPLAWAGAPEQTACCAASGVDGCGGRLRLYGEDTRLSRDAGGWLLDGAWLVTCDGIASFADDEQVYLDHAPQPGEIVMPEVASAEVSCFASACSLPQGLCVSDADAYGRRSVRLCANGMPPTPADLRRPPVAATVTRVVIGGKLLYAGPVAPPVAAPPPPEPAPAVAVGNLSVNDPIAALVAGLPPDPTPTCKAASDAARVESRQLVLNADDLRISGDNAGALARFRAALSVDRCNAYGWLGLGQAALSLSRPDLGVRALSNATLLLPRHYGAWTELGKAYEALGDRPQAQNAYARALGLNPEYPDAVAGARRVASP